MDGVMLDKEYRMCNRCVMDNSSDDTISFDENGYCNYCTSALKEKEEVYFPNDEGKRRLEEIIRKIKNDEAKKKYDCIVGVSGGVDSTYVLYLGYNYGLRMLTVHIDDGLDTDISKENIRKICEKTNSELMLIKPDLIQYKDITLAFFLAGLPNVAIPQDNIILKELIEVSKKNNINYLLSGGNFSCEGILQAGNSHPAIDLTHIKTINKLFGKEKIDKLNFISMSEKFLDSSNKRITYRPLNYIDYNLNKVLNELSEFAQYNYYGGKHYESILTRFMQCYYLPKKFNVDKRKSHFSSMIISRQMTRNEALEKLKEPLYINEELLNFDVKFLADYFGISLDEFKKILDSTPRKHTDYKCSKLYGLKDVGISMKKIIRKDR